MGTNVAYAVLLKQNNIHIFIVKKKKLLCWSILLYSNIVDNNEDFLLQILVF